jgi:hypothetical protein
VYKSGRMDRSHASAVAVGVALVALAAVAPAGAHHSFAADYDVKRPITLKGTVTRAEWTNPHVHFYLNVTDPSGAVIEWELEMGAVNGLFRRGWTRSMLAPGDVVVVDGYLARERSNLANARVVTLRDGRKMSGGTAPDTPAK